jgi:hypothetical protein
MLRLHFSVYKFCLIPPSFCSVMHKQRGHYLEFPFDWLCKSYGERGVKTWWKRASGGNGIFPICHREEPKHVPKDCGLLKAFNLKVINVAPVASPPAPPPPSSIPVEASPSPEGRVASAVTLPTSGLAGSGMAPSGLTTAVAITLEVSDNFDLVDNFHWAGDESGVDYCDYHKSNKTVAPCILSCSSIEVSFISSSTPLALSTAASSLVMTPSTSPMVIPSTFHMIYLSCNLHRLICHVTHSLIGIKLSKHFVVADTGATDHMLPNKSAFISHKAIFNLQVWMGKKSFIPVLGCGSAVVSLNGQPVLIRNTLHVPSLVVPLYSLHTHLTHCGCSFYGAYEAGMLVCFPTFVLTVDMLSDCHLSYVPLCCCVPLDTLHYVQPWGPATLYSLPVRDCLFHTFVLHGHSQTSCCRRRVGGFGH